MSTITKLDLIAMAIIVALVLIFKPPGQEPEVVETVPSFPNDTSYVDPFTLDPDVLLGPAVIEPECVDTHKPDDISCADKAAVIKFRKAKAAERVEQLKKEIEQKMNELTNEKYGLREC